MIRTFIFLIFGSLVIAALLTPGVMEAIQFFDPGNKWPYSRVFGRIGQVIAVFIILLRRKDFNLSELKNQFLTGRFFDKISKLSSGAFLTLTSIALVIPSLVYVGVVVYATQFKDSLVQDVAMILFSMFCVSVIEESFFRVLVFSSLKRKVNIWLAASLSSFLYSFVHFIAPIKGFIPQGSVFFSGLDYLLEIFSLYFTPGIYSSFFGLFIVGMILCYTMHKTNSLFLCIGLHMGWAAGLKFVKIFTVLPDGHLISNDLAGRYFLVSQPIAWFSMLAVFCVIYCVINLSRVKKAV